MSRIASFDWPDSWPDLFTILIQALHSMDGNIIHGAMRVFTEFAGEISDLQVPQIAPTLLPEMLKIFKNTQVYGVRTSSRSVNIFSTIAGLIGLMRDFYKGIEKEHLYPYLPEFLSTCSQQLALPDGPSSDCGIKMEILKALEVLVKHFPKYMLQHITSILPPVWAIFTQSVDHYIKTTINCIDSTDDVVDEDGEILSFENLVYSTFEFIVALVESSKFKKTVQQYLEEILFFTMVYMQITDEQVDLWSNDPNQFVEDEDEETLSYSVRISAQFLILTLCQRFKEAPQKLFNAVGRLKLKGDELRTQGDEHWWKYYEVILLCLGYVQQSILEKVETGELKDDFKNSVKEMLVTACSTEAGSAFLVGQSFWTSSKLAAILDDQSISHFLQATVGALGEGQNTVLRVFAVKSLYGFCDYLRDSNKTNLLHPFLEQIAAGILSMATQFSESVLALTLETLMIVIKVNLEFTSTLVQNSQLIPLINALYLKYATDHHLEPIIEDLLGDLAEIPTCYAVIMEKIVPTLLSILEAPEDKVPPVMVAPTIDVLTVLIRKGPKPIQQSFILNTFPLVSKKALQSDDEGIIQNCGECIRAFIACSAEEVFSWQDGSGHNGLYYIVQVTCKLLDPKASESSAMFIGKLINTLVIKGGNVLGDNLEIILRSVLSKLQQAKTFSVIQSLLMVFIQLIRYQIEATLEFLSTVPGPTGKSALDYVLTEWCSKQDSFFGNYETKVSYDALCKLLLHAVTTGDSRFEEIVVPDQQMNDTQEIMTRSKAKQAKTQTTFIPVGIKLFKLVVNEMMLQMEQVENDADDSEDEDGDDWEDVDEDGRPPKDMTIQQAIEAIFSPAGDFAGFGDDEEDEDDPDTLDDPINQVKLKDWLNEFIRSFSQQPCFSNFVQTLNENERQCLIQLQVVVS
ncbi:importin-9-like isoform X2 [Clytia hemisphaerica]